MPVYISMLRAINVGGHGSVKMDALRSLYTTLKLENAQSYVQSGNVVFRTSKTDETILARNIEQAIAKTFAVTTTVVLRSRREMRAVVKANPFVDRKNIEPGKLLVDFLLETPSLELREKIEGLAPANEEIHVNGREIYIYFPDGSGRSKLPSLLDRALKGRATGRNWNSVTKLLAMAESLQQ